jgi:repressor of nif and glnA expression
MKEKWNRKQVAIFHILKNSIDLISSPKITEMLNIEGHDISERTVRYYLEDMGKKSYTEKKGKLGYNITEKGLHEIDSITIIEKVGFLSSRINKIAYKMSFNPDKMSGTVIVNLSIANPMEIKHLFSSFKKVYEKDMAMGQMLMLVPPGETFHNLKIPDHMIGIGTVCSVTLNGVLLKNGIPTNSVFGGILALADNKPFGFVDVIKYDGTSMDPLEIFIRSGMTNYLGAIKTGHGRVGASFQEYPSESRDYVLGIIKKMRKARMMGGYILGSPNKSLLKIPVNEGSIGAIVMGGLNPVAVFEESGIRVQSKALTGLVDYKQLFHYTELNKHLKKIL